MKTTPAGLGIWVAFRSRLGTAEQSAALCRDIGARWVAPRAGDGSLNDSSLSKNPAAEIAAYHAVGLKVYPWLYSRPSTWRSEVKAFAKLMDAGADGILVDGEIQWANKGADAIAYGKELRAALGDAWIGDCPWPMIGWHPEYPTSEFAEFIDGRMPQAYWSEINSQGAQSVCAEYEKQWSAWEAKHPALVRPRLPIGVTYGRREGLKLGLKPIPPGECTVADVSWFLDKYGPTASLYSLEAASDDVVAALKKRALPPPPDPRMYEDPVALQCIPPTLMCEAGPDKKEA